MLMKDELMMDGDPSNSLSNSYIGILIGGSSAKAYQLQGRKGNQKRFMWGLLT